LAKLAAHARTESITLAHAQFSKARGRFPYIRQPENLAGALLGPMWGNAEHLLKLLRGQHVNH